MLEINKIHQGDCLELMKQIKNKSVDMILCDLPYGTTACKWDSIIPFDKLWEQYKRIIKNKGVIVLTGSQPFTSALIMSNPKMFKYCWVWEKNRSTGHVHAKNKPMKRHEDIIIFSSGNTLHKSQSTNRMPYFPQGIIEMEGNIKRRTRNDAGNNAVMGARKSHKSTMYTHTNFPTSIIKFDIQEVTDRVHPTQKPLTLGRYLVKTYTNEGDLVLDNTCGVGSFPLSAKMENRKFIGIELDKKYCEIAQKRIEEQTKQRTLLPLAENSKEDGIPPTNKLVGILPKKL